MAESESLDCPCSNIAIMQLFHELKQSYPKVPDQKVSKIIQENFHDKTACETILQQESHAYLQSYPGAIISGSSRDGLERGSICNQCPSSRSSLQSNSPQHHLQYDMSEGRTLSTQTRQDKSAFLTSEDDSIYSPEKSECVEYSRDKSESRNSGEKGRPKPSYLEGQTTGEEKPKSALENLFQDKGQSKSLEAQRVLDKAGNETSLREFLSAPSAGVGVIDTIECCDRDSSNCSRISCSECVNERKMGNLKRFYSCPSSQNFKGTVGCNDAGSVSWNVEDGGKSSGGSIGFIGSPHSSGDMPVHNYQVAVQYSMQPALSLHQGQQRSFTTVNLSLRPPSSEPQPPIEICSAQNLIYTTSVYDAKKGVQSQLQIRIGSGGGGTVSACRTYISSPQTRFCCRSPYCTPHTSSGFQCQNNHHLKALLEKQKERKEQLAKELRKEKEKLLSMQKEVRLLKASIARKPSPQLLSKLKSEIDKLRAECERLTAAVDLYSDSQDHLPLGETDEEFYRNIYTGQSLQREGSWSCRLCTFRNHPLLSVCEECEMPRISLGTQVKDVTTHLSVLPNNNTSFCPGGGTSTSASLITAPLQER